MYVDILRQSLETQTKSLCIKASQTAKCTAVTQERAQDVLLVEGLSLPVHMVDATDLGAWVTCSFLIITVCSPAVSISAKKNTKYTTTRT